MEKIIFFLDNIFKKSGFFCMVKNPIRDNFITLFHIIV